MPVTISPPVELQVLRLIAQARPAPQEAVLLLWAVGTKPVVVCKRSGPALRTHVKRANRMSIPLLLLPIEHELRRAMASGGAGAEALALDLLAAHCIHKGKRIAGARPDEQTGIVLCLDRHAGHSIKRLSLPRGHSRSANAVRAEMALDHLGVSSADINLKGSDGNG